MFLNTEILNRTITNTEKTSNFYYAYLAEKLKYDKFKTKRLEMQE